MVDTPGSIRASSPFSRLPSPGPPLGVRFWFQTERGSWGGLRPSVRIQYLAQCREQSGPRFRWILESAGGLMERWGSQGLGAVNRGIPRAGGGRGNYIPTLRGRIWRGVVFAPMLSQLLRGVLESPAGGGYFTFRETPLGLWSSGTCKSTPGGSGMMAAGTATARSATSCLGSAEWL